MLVQTALFIFLLSLSTIPLPAAGANPSANPSKTQDRRKPETQKTQAAATLTGSVDEGGSRHVLTVDRTLAPAADLESEGFPREGFAKHLGQKVTVQGQKSLEGERIVFRVRSITMVSETRSSSRQ
jgi:hypothetical protein